LVIVPFGFVDDGIARQKTLQVQPQMQLGRRLAPPVLRPAKVGHDQLDRRGIHRMDRSLKTAQRSTSPTSKSRGGLLQVLQDSAEQSLD
jgi:hypothetical protein